MIEIAKLDFLKSTQNCLKIKQLAHPCDQILRNNRPLNFWKITDYDCDVFNNKNFEGIEKMDRVL